jgi:hypothetical protein
MKPLRFTGKTHLGLGPHCDYFLDGAALDPRALFVVDECAGYVERGEILPLATAGPGTPKAYRWRLDPVTKRPVVTRREGSVQIKLRADAPTHLRELYRGLREGTVVPGPFRVQEEEDAG